MLISMMYTEIKQNKASRLKQPTCDFFLIGAFVCECHVCSQVLIMTKGMVCARVYCCLLCVETQLVFTLVLLGWPLLLNQHDWISDLN